MPIFSTLRRHLDSSYLLVYALAAGAPSLAAGAPAEHLRAEPSAFLRANADSLVEWLPWGEAAFERAKAEKKPVFVAVGVFSSELSRAMARQSFSNEKIAALLNANFVCVLVDREEHPEVAAQYLAYVRTVKQLDGWPLNIWLTPELTPYEGATYLPPSEEWGKTSFTKTAQQAKDAWAADPAACRAHASEAVTSLTPSLPPLSVSGKETEKFDAALTDAASAWRGRFDATHGGFGDPPRNPEPELLRFLLNRTSADREAALASLKAIANSALRDPLDGGFFRNAADDAWRLPYPQKMLSDQARLALAFLEAAPLADAAVFEQAARGALDCALNHFALTDGTFAGVEDGTGDEQAGYFAWTAAEIDALLGADAAEFKRIHGVEDAGNVSADLDSSGHLKGKNLLHSVLPANAQDIAATTRLHTERDRRPALPRDERATCGAHGLLLAALARAGEQLHEPRYLESAQKLFDAVKKQFLMANGDLRRLRGSSVQASPADYAALALGCRELARAAKIEEAETVASRLLAHASEVYFSPASGRYYGAPEKLPSGLFFRPPALPETPGAEPLAVMAARAKEKVPALSAALFSSLSEGEAAAPGDVLLALALSAARN